MSYGKYVFLNVIFSYYFSSCMEKKEFYQLRIRLWVALSTTTEKKNSSAYLIAKILAIKQDENNFASRVVSRATGSIGGLLAWTLFLLRKIDLRQQLL